MCSIQLLQSRPPKSSCKGFPVSLIHELVVLKVVLSYFLCLSRKIGDLLKMITFTGELFPSKENCQPDDFDM